ncbi:MAG: preprotein translocase subunit YajC [Burkholderia sp.]|nr:preprotein translocase subunit YajC [Burkholderia sp.]
MLLISNAFAQDLVSNTESDKMRFLPIILMFILFYFGMIRPNMKRQKDHRKIISSIKKDDEIITNSGIFGKVIKIYDDTYIQVEIAEGTKITMQKVAVSNILPKGTIKLF